MKTIKLSTQEFSELSTPESQQISGGFVWLVAIATAYLGFAMFQAMENPERIVNGFLDALQ